MVTICWYNNSQNLDIVLSFHNDTSSLLWTVVSICLFLFLSFVDIVITFNIGASPVYDASG